MSEMRKNCKWSDIVEEFPEKWAFVTDIHEDKDGETDTCTLVAVCSHDEKAHFINEFLKKGLVFECIRTTFSAPNMGLLC